MRILFISRWFPYPPDNGSKIRIFNLLKQLSRRHDITLLSFAQGQVSKKRLTHMEHYCHRVHTAQYREFRPTGLKALLGLFSARPRSVIDTFSRDMLSLVHKQSINNRFDVVIASQVDSVPYALLINHTPRVLEEVELSIIYEQFARQRSIASKARYGLTWWKLSHYMAQILHNFKGCTVVSEKERDLVMSIKPSCDVLTVVPNGIDLKSNTGEFGTPRPDTLIYNGALTYSANFDAMEFFLREIFPLVKAQHSDVNLRITGNHNAVPIERLPLGNGAKLTGYLDDIRPAVAQSWAVVVPLRVGAGTRVKILEAMALGTPVISTSKGAEGLEVIDGKNILIADDPDDFAECILRLLKDEDLRAKLSANGRQLVEKRYSWDMCAHQLDQLLCQVVEQHRN